MALASDDPLAATRRLRSQLSDPAPVIVVGLPRSGSSFLSDVLSQFPDWYVFDDLYLQTRAESLGAKPDRPLSQAQFDELLAFLRWQIWARLKYGRFAIPSVREDEIDPMNEALRGTFGDELPTWPVLQEEWMTRLALRAGATRWGWKMPQGFMSLDLLERLYPGLRVIYLLRRPESVLASYKAISAEDRDGHPDQYFPVIYARYWRMAARAWLDGAGEPSDRRILIRFEELVADTDTTAKRLAAFLETEATKIRPQSANSSFNGRSGRAAQDALSGLELRIISRIAGQERALLFPDSTMPEKRIQPKDWAELGATGARFIRFRALQAFKKPASVMSAKRFANRLFKP